jgi:hypothetical protein
MIQSAGYSKRSVVEKLGIKAGFAVAFVGSPSDFHATLGRLPERVTVRKGHAGSLDFIHFFSKDRREVEGKLPRLKLLLLPDGMLWVSWPKGSWGVKTDLNENIIRAIALKNGLVDVKVCAVDDTWSGLKLVCRLKGRL